VGRRGPLPKPAGRAVGHHPRAEIVRLVPKQERTVPRAPDGLLGPTRKAWRAFWESPKAELVSPEVRPALERLFQLRDDLEREHAIFREARLVKGSMGQIRMNPLAGHLLALEGAISRLEAEFGLTPLAASRLGLLYGEATRSLEDMNRRFRAEQDERQDEEGDDPLAALLQSRADGRRTPAADPRP
jgi:hypothetical protein